MTELVVCGVALSCWKQVRFRTTRHLFNSKKKVFNISSYCIEITLRPSTHSLTSVLFGLGMTSAICVIYTIHTTSHPQMASIQTGHNNPNHKYDLFFPASNKKFYIKITQFYTWFIKNFLRSLKIILKIYIKFSQK